MKFHAHHLIAKTAKGMAEAVYEETMKDNKVYAEWKRRCPDLTPEYTQQAFVALLYPLLLEKARHTLAGMLAGNYPDILKEQIADALIKDNRFREGRNRALTNKYGSIH